MHISPETLGNQDFESMLMSRMSVALLQSSKLVCFKLFRYIMSNYLTIPLKTRPEVVVPAQLKPLSFELKSPSNNCFV